ncbi:MAG: phosphotransferase [Myxococcales bacterium]|nr:phosphotransferase [Myxococcales bacterium]
MESLWGPACEQPQDRVAFERWVDDATSSETLARILCAQEKISFERMERAKDGSLPVFFLDDARVIKIFPLLFQDEWVNECAVLEKVQGQLPCEVPEVLSTGSWEGWHYVLMRRLQGRSVVQVWDDLSLDEKLELSEQLGACLRALHQIPSEKIASLPWGWGALYQERRERLLEHHRGKGLSEAWCEQLEGFLDRFVHEELFSVENRVLLHTEIMRAHVFCSRGDGEKTYVSGFLDFEPSMVGPREYEFASVGIFWAQGDPAILRRLCLGYGFAEHELNHTLQCRWMAQVLLHRYSHLPWYFRFMPMREEADTFEKLAALWFAFSA